MCGVDGCYGRKYKGNVWMWVLLMKGYHDGRRRDVMYWIWVVVEYVVVFDVVCGSSECGVCVGCCGVW